MAHAGPEFYDDEHVFAIYHSRRQRPDAPNDTLEKPVIMELIGAPAGKRVLDLGCGDGAIGRELLELGAADYVGVEGSHKMAALAAKTLEGTRGRVITQSIEEWTATPGDFDIVLSRLALHYVADLAPVLRNVYQGLNPGGRLVFSVEHPVITSYDNSLPREAWLVDDYFMTGKRVTEWMGGTIVKYHRTLEDYYGLVQAAGLRVNDLREACPQPRYFQDPQNYERRKRIPLFLILSACKPTT